ENNYFYIDKTKFIKEWWLGGSDVTLITRPRRFGKTLLLDTVRTFFAPEISTSCNYFEKFAVWQDETLRNLHGTVPVIFLSFADLKESNYDDLLASLKELVIELYRYFFKILEVDTFPDWEKKIFQSINHEMSDVTLKRSLRNLSECLTYHYHKKPIILLDEYDTPLHEAWEDKYWSKLVKFMRSFFNSTFKTNAYLDRGLITGITRVSKESIFSDFNNLEVVTVTSRLYADSFGFTEKEVLTALNLYRCDTIKEVKFWYDGFVFGSHKGIYNPWSIICYLKNKEFAPYWANTGSNFLVGSLIAKSGKDIKEQVCNLLKGESIFTKLDEQISYTQLCKNNESIWSLLMAAGYVKPLGYNVESNIYQISLTNHEVYISFNKFIAEWFEGVRDECNSFRYALLNDNLVDMNKFMSDISESTFSFFDTGKQQSESFYHAFVLGLMIDLKDRYEILSNRESGYGRYDLSLIPKHPGDHGIVIEFKTQRIDLEKDLEETSQNALNQICEKKYCTEQVSRGIPYHDIYIYGFAFCGKKLLIQGGSISDFC
ncbi:MAG: AAA family ATPase, partial [Desulfovibrio sp.]|nr:AAA family ATPase [Desulfovibrio sp.]